MYATIKKYLIPIIKIVGGFVANYFIFYVGIMYGITMNMDRCGFVLGLGQPKQCNTSYEVIPISLAFLLPALISYFITKSFKTVNLQIKIIIFCVILWPVLSFMLSRMFGY